MKETQVVVVSLDQLEAILKKHLAPFVGDNSTPLGESLTQSQAAQFLGVVPMTMIKWRKEGKVPFYQVGRKIYYDKKDLIKVAQKNPKMS